MEKTFEQKLRAYANVIVKIGLNIRPGQRLTVRAPIAAADLARAVAERAYEAGCRLVDVLWNDEALGLIRFQRAPRDSFDEIASWKGEMLLEGAKRGDAMLAIYAENPDLLEGQDSELVSRVQKNGLRNLQAYREYIQKNGVNWCVVSSAVPAWAQKVFPKFSKEERTGKLWEAIFRMCRIDEEDPMEAWRTHIAKLANARDILNEKQYGALRVTGPGTDLTVGLPARHLWASADAKTTDGREIDFVANIPTEEVFTMPHKDKVNGIVASSRPLHYAGNVIENFTLTFRDGRVVEAQAERGGEMLWRLIQTDEGASRLGEIALVPHSSPVSRSGLLFYNTLFDENAACHLALGRAYSFSIEGGTAMTDGEFFAAGGNISIVHDDFMIGNARTNVDGITKEGNAEPIMREGEWAFN